MKKTLFITALALALAGCASGPESDKEYMDLVAKAKAEIQLAGKAGYAWRDTEKFLKGADEAMKAGDRDKAMKLVNKAIKQAQLSQKQAKDNANAKPVY
ncbi:MAG: hypothetical protein AAB194_04365 [Pseudomonadota bacterium]